MKYSACYIPKGLVALAIRNAICANRFAIDAPMFITRQADSPESVEFPIRANHATKFQGLGVRIGKFHTISRCEKRKVSRKFCPAMGWRRPLSMKCSVWWPSRGFEVKSHNIFICHGALKTCPSVQKFWRVTIRGSEPSVRLSEVICLSERFLEASAGVSSRVLPGSAGFCGGFVGFSEGSGPVHFKCQKNLM